MKKAIAALVVSLALIAPAGAAAAESERFDKTFTLQPNTTETYRTTLSSIGQNCNVLEPGWGLEVQGPGVDLALGMMGDFWGGPAILEPGKESPPDGAGYVRHPDGSWWKPEPAETPFTAEQVRLGLSLRQVDWDYRRLDRWGNPKPAAGAARSAKASKRLRARRLRAASRRIRGHAAQTGPVTVTLAGFEYMSGKLDMLARVTTGELAGPTTLTLRVSVAIQPGTPSLGPDGCRVDG